MRTFRKVVAISIICIILGTMFGGCSTTTTAPTTAPPTATTTPPASTTTKPGVTTVSTTPSTTGKQDPIEVKMIAGLFSEIPDMNNAYWKEYQRLTNSKLSIEWIDSNNFTTVYTLRLTAGDIPEVSALFQTPSTILEAVVNGAYYDLTPLLGDFSKYPNLMKNSPPDCWIYNRMNGKIFSLPRNRSRIDSVVNIRQDWVEALGLKMPTTLDEYADVMGKIVKGDADGNGKVDTIGLLGNDGGTVPVGAFAASFGAYDGVINADGGQYNPYMTDGYFQALKYMKKLYDNGVLDPEFATALQSQSQAIMNSNRATTYITAVLHEYDWETNSAKIQKSTLKPKVTPVVLTGPKGTAALIITGYQGGFYISSKVPEAKVKRYLDYFEAATSAEATTLGYYGILGVHHTIVDGVPKLTEQGIKEVNVTSRGAGTFGYTQWGKVDNAAASKAYNDAKRSEVAILDKVAKIDLWNIGTLYSPTWISLWPKYMTEFQSMESKYVTGKITEADFLKYQQGLRDMPDFKKAFQEFAVAYKAMEKAKAGT